MRQYKVFVFTIQVLLVHQILIGGVERTAQPTALFSRGGVGIAMNDPEHCWINPATIASVGRLNASLFYSPSPYQLPQLSNFGLMLSGSLGPVNGAFGFSSVGFSLYKESIGSVSAAALLTDDFGVGINVHTIHLMIANYGSALFFTADVGTVYELSRQFRIGAAFRNLSGSAFGADDDIPRIFQTGITALISENITVCADLIKDVRYPVNIQWGVEFSPIEELILRSGVNDSVSKLFGGVGIRTGALNVNYGVSLHSDLGLSQSIGISVR